MNYSFPPRERRKRGCVAMSKMTSPAITPLGKAFGVKWFPEMFGVGGGPARAKERDRQELCARVVRIVEGSEEEILRLWVPLSRFG